MLTGTLADQSQQMWQNQRAQEQATTPTNSAELWKKIQEILPDVRSQRLAYLLYHCGLKPREIITCCGQEFNDLTEIYRLRYDIIEKLLHNKIFPV